MIFLFISVVILSGILSLIFSHKRYVKRNEEYLINIPGPKPNPFFGNMLDFAVPSYKFFNVIENYSDKYGDTFIIYLGPLTQSLALAEENLIEYILSSTKIIDKSFQYQYFQNWLGDGLLLSKESAMGISVNAQTDGDSEYVRNVKTICSIITDRNFSPLDPRMYPLTINYYKEKKALKVIHSHTDMVIEKRINDLKNVKDAKESDNDGIKKKLAFLDLLLKSTIDGKPLSKIDIREEVDTFMFEGHDTTSSAISFALYLLANHPLVQQKVVEEQHEIFGDTKDVHTTLADLQNMRYLELVVKETLRLYPSVPLIGREVTEEFVWENVKYPEGLTILIVPHLIHRNPKYFPNPLEFIPERFLEMDGKHPYRYIPFSAGPRNCIGQKFAMLEMKSTISRVIRNFKLFPSKTKQEMKLAPEIILLSKNGIRLTLKKRI